MQNLKIPELKCEVYFAEDKVLAEIESYKPRGWGLVTGLCHAGQAALLSAHVLHRNESSCCWSGSLNGAERQIRSKRFKRIL